jgi:choline-sulfatase
VLPTLPKLCGLDVPSTLNGKSLAPNLKDPEERIESAAYAEFGLGAGGGMQMIRHGDFKYVYNYNDIEQLYDLRRDPQEITNLALLPGHKETARRLRQELFKIFNPSPGN